MALTPRLDIKQTQSLLLTPQLRQAISLLAMTNQELSETLEQELASNPLLEREETALADAETKKENTIDDYDTPASETEEFTAPEGGLENECDDFGSDTEGYSFSETADWSDYNQSKSKKNDDDSFDYFEQRLSKEKSLYELLDEQINLKFLTPNDRLIAKILSEHLDRAGYFRGNLEEIAQRLKTTPPRLRNVLVHLKDFEPSGIFAETLSECLKIQLKDQNALTPAFEIFLENLPLLAERKYKALAELCACSLEEILSMSAALKSLDPKPAARFFCEKESYVIPDVLVKRGALGAYRVELNTLTLPRLIINRRYYAELKTDKKAARYLKENLSRASFLIKAMQSRATTILRVSEEIVLRQYAFFENGIEHLRPMTLKDIAETLEINESTVSRVTTGKYMETPRGLFELKYFFSSAAGSYIGNEETSTTTLKHKIKTLIETESPTKILPDDTIVALLGQEGYKIARRTVAKYREAMGLPTSAERKRAKRG